MKAVLILIILAAAAYLAFLYLGTGEPQEITDPVFAEIRIDRKVAGRELNLVLFGEMRDEEDCRERAELVWEKVVADCAECTMKVSSCSAELQPRYRRLFDNVQIQSTYLSFTRGSNDERNGRMVIFGLTAAEEAVACEAARQAFQQRYSGSIECIAGRT